MPETYSILEVFKMKHNFWSLCMGALVALMSFLLVLTSSASAWGKVKYSFACVILGMAVCYVGDRL